MERKPGWYRVRRNDEWTIAKYIGHGDWRWMGVPLKDTGFSQLTDDPISLPENAPLQPEQYRPAGYFRVKFNGSWSMANHRGNGHWDWDGATVGSLFFSEIGGMLRPYCHYRVKVDGEYTRAQYMGDLSWCVEPHNIIKWAHELQEIGERYHVPLVGAPQHVDPDEIPLLKVDQAPKTFTDSDILDFLQRHHTLHGAVSMLYVVNGYEVALTQDDEPVGPVFKRDSLREALIKLMQEER